MGVSCGQAERNQNCATADTAKKTCWGTQKMDINNSTDQPHKMQVNTDFTLKYSRIRTRPGITIITHWQELLSSYNDEQAADLVPLVSLKELTIHCGIQ